MATTILQHWAHPGLSERWAGILARVEFLLQPLEQISPGGRFPQTARGSLGLLTFHRQAILGQPAILSLAEPAEQAHVGQTINIDFPASEEAAAWQILVPVLVAGRKYPEPLSSLHP